MALVQLGRLLKTFRTRIQPSVEALGSYERAPSRRGRPVTQEEVAEAIGTTRVWYAMLESGQALRTTAQLLGRLADTLMLDERELATLFALGIPELHRLGLRPESTALASSRRLRDTVRRLWAASSEAEALTAASEHLAAAFDADGVRYGCRAYGEMSNVRPMGDWAMETILEPRRGSSFAEMAEDVARRLTPLQIDELMFYPDQTQPGDLATLDTYAESRRRFIVDLWEEHGIGSAAASFFVSARVRSRRGFVGNLFIYREKSHDVSESEYLEIATLADVVSLALS